jgi:hypothetical protein
VSQEIVLKHHGLMRVRSRTSAVSDASNPAGSGTVFEIFLPDEPSFPTSGFSAGNAVAASPAGPQPSGGIKS